MMDPELENDRREHDAVDQLYDTCCIVKKELRLCSRIILERKARRRQ